MPTIKRTPNGYGFGYDWTLVFEREDGSIGMLWMGQGAKVCVRILGVDGRDLVPVLKEHSGKESPGLEDLAWLVIEALGGLERVRTLQPWEAHAGGG